MNNIGVKQQTRDSSYNSGPQTPLLTLFGMMYRPKSVKSAVVYRHTKRMFQHEQQNECHRHDIDETATECGRSVIHVRIEQAIAA